MFFVLSKIIDIFLSPLMWALVLIAIAIPWRRPRRPARTVRWRRQRIFGALGILILYVFSIDVTSNRMLYALEHATSPSYRPDVVYDAVVLLGGISDEQVTSEQKQPAYNDNVERLIETHRLLADGHARFAIVSGGSYDKAYDEFSEARVLERQLVLWGIDPSRVIIEDKARNTRENATYSKRIADERGFKNVLVVTSAFHMRRSIECFNAAEMKVDTMLVDYRAHEGFAEGSSFLPRTGSLNQSSMTLREFFGLYIYRLQGYARAAPPAGA